jgi:addiction module HigA family antidote
MAAQKNRYNPDYATPPGWLLEAELEALGISKGEFARRCGCSAREIKKIIAGEAPIGPQMAIQIARISGGGPDIWLRMESNYRLRSAQLAEMATSPQYAEWVKRFPTAELAARDAIDEPESVGNTAAQLLAFFGFATLDEWRAEHATAKNAYRYSTAFDGDEAVLATWLQFGEIEAVYTKCPDYDEAVFMQSLHKIRSLTAAGTDDCLPEAQRLCQQSGVILAFVEPLAQLDISGAAWWFSLTKAVIQLDPRHETDELLWASFFHGAAHILLDSKRDIFIDLPSGNRREGDHATHNS